MMIRDKFLNIIFFILIFCIFAPSNSKVKCKDEGNNPQKKIVYLTFDDGPSEKVTNKVLDILKCENVPGTFFVIGNQIKNQENTILRMKNEGHSIGLHSFSHNRNILYRSNDDFISEMKKVQNELKNVTGETYTIIRFPFGCNNITYKLTTSLVNIVHEHDFKIYDWTQDSLDGANPHSSPESILKNSVSNKDYVIVLMHCSNINKNSANALPSIIKYYKNNGYEFKKITESTPEIYKITRKNKWGCRNSG